MPLFKYIAYNSGGKEVAGELEAVSLKAASLALRGEGLHPKSLSPAEAVKRRSFSFSRGGVSLIELSMATDQLQTLITSGVPLHEALTILSGECESRVLSQKFIEIKDAIREGASLNKALDSHPDVFPDVYRRMVEAAESTGTLEVVLKRLGEYLETRAQILQKVRAALTYPAFMIAVCAAVLALIFIFVIPKITMIFEDSERALPFITVVLLFIVDILRYYWFVILALVVASTYFLNRYLRTEEGKRRKDELLIRVPLVGTLVRKYYTSNLARTLGSLISGGVPMLKALEMTRKVVMSAPFEDALDNAIVEVTEGGSLSKSLGKYSQASVTGMMVHMVAVGERGGNIDEMLLKTADAYDKELENAIERNLKLLEPIIIILMAGVVGFIVASILLPIFELNQIPR